MNLSNLKQQVGFLAGDDKWCNKEISLPLSAKDWNTELPTLLGHTSTKEDSFQRSLIVGYVLVLKLLKITMKGLI